MNSVDKEFLSPLGGLVQEYHDRFFIDDSLVDRDVLLLCVYVSDHKAGVTGADYDSLRQIFVTLGKKIRNFPATLSVLGRDGFVDYDRKSKKIFFTSKGLKRVKEILGEYQDITVYVLKAGQKFSSAKLFEQFLSDQITAPTVLLCDAFIAAQTLFPFSALSGSLKELRILTQNIFDHDKYYEYKKRLKKESGITVLEKTNDKIHDRYLVSGKGAWIIGTSIKDLGNKDSIIKEVKELHDTLSSGFETRWKEGH